MTSRNIQPVTPEAADGGYARPTILLVEDDGALRDALARLLSGNGYHLKSACDGKDAESSIRQELPDLILTDLIMPNRDGLEFLGFLREHAPSVPVIAMSGRGRISPANYLELAQRMGAVRTLEKPFPTTQLLAVVREVLDQHPPANSTPGESIPSLCPTIRAS